MKNTITKINLSNLKKCGQVWDDMPENESGRLCLKCSNTIIDFRNLTDSEIAKTHLFSDYKVCGLYKKEQLYKPQRKTKSGILNKWNSFYLGVFSFLAFNSYGQKDSKSINTEQTAQKYDALKIKKSAENNETVEVARDSVFISGKLTDETNVALPFANVIIKGTRVGVTSNYEGVYMLDVTKVLDSLSKVTLVYSYIGYNKIEKTIDSDFLKAEENRTINVKFIEGEVIEFVVYERAPFHKRVWNGIKNIFRRKKE